MGERRMARVVCIILALALLMVIIPPSPAEATDDRVTMVIERSYGLPMIGGDPLRAEVPGLDQRMMDDVPYLLPVEELELVIEDGAVSDLRVDYLLSAKVPLGVVDLPMQTVSSVLGQGPAGSGDSRTSHVNNNGLYDRRGENVLLLSLSPLSFDPATKEMWYVAEITVIITYAVEEVETDPQPLSTPYDLLILTCPMLEDEFDRIADWKQAVGFDVRVVNTTTALDGSPLSAPALKSFINNEYNVSGISYVLLAGDADAIPAWYVTQTVTFSGGSPTTMDLASDHYYASFNYAVDWTTTIYPYADVSVGRVPLSAAVDAEAWVEKLLSYENRSEPSYLNEVLFIGERLDALTYGGDVKDTIEPYIPSSYNLTKLYERDEGTLSFTQVRAAVEDGAHIINHMGHGNVNDLAYITDTNADLITSPMPNIWYSQACLVGAFDMDDNVAVAMLADEDNAVAMVLNSRYGIYQEHPNEEQGPSNKFDKAFMDKLFDDTLLLGDVHHRSKETLVSQLDNDYILWVYTELNLLGDPTMRLGGYEEPPRDPIRIDDDVTLEAIVANEGWPGDGSAASPYIIEGYTVRGSGADVIYVGNTTKDLIIRDNTIRQSVGGQDGIRLHNVTNVSLESNSLSNKQSGINITESTAVTVANNTFSNNAVAIVVTDSTSCMVTGNRLVSGNGQGIVLTGDSSSELRNNTISRCSGLGVSVQGTGVTVTDNSFYLNNGSYPQFTVNDPQAANVGANDWDGNFWFRHDGVSYDLSGATDNSPLTADPLPVPEFDTAALDALQGGDVMPSTSLDFTATSVLPLSFYALSIDEDAFVVSTPTFNFGSLGLSSGPHNLSMVAFTEAGNAEIYTLSVVYAVADVSVTITSPTDYYVDSNRITVRWTSADSDNVSHYLVRIDSGDWQNVSKVTRYTTPSLSEGVHTISVRAVGFDGNIVTAVKEVFVDTIAPSLSFVGVAEGQIFTDNRILIGWTSADPEPASGLSHFTLRIDSSTTITIDDPTATSHLTMPLSEGGHRITLRAYDEAGNYVQRVANIIVDSIAPAITFNEAPDHPYSDENLDVAWTVTEDGSGVESLKIRMNRGAWTDVTGLNEYTFEGLGDGYYDVEIRAEDRAGHVSYTSSGRVVATQQAVLDFINPHNSGYSKSPDTFSWNVWDKRGYSYTYEYSVDGGEFVSNGALNTKQLSLDQGPHTIQVRATAVETGSVLNRAISFITLVHAQPPMETNPSYGEDEFLFDQPLRATFALTMLIDKDLTTMTLTDSGANMVEGESVWSGNEYRFEPSSHLDHPATYLWRINVVDLAGNTVTVPVTFSVKEITLPGAPQNLTSSHIVGWDGVSITLEWDPPSDDGGYPAGLDYNIYRRSNDTDFEVIATVSGNSYTDGSVTWDNYYLYYVTAVNPVGEGPGSEVNVTGLPPEPGTWEKISLFLGHIGEVLGATWDMIVEQWDAITETAGGFWDELIAAITDALRTLGDALVGLGNAIIDAIEMLYHALVAGFDAIGQFLVGILDFIGHNVVALIDYLMSLQGWEAVTGWTVVLLSLLLLYMLLTPPKGREVKVKRPVAEDYTSPYARRTPKKEAAYEGITDMPRTLESTISLQNGLLIAEEIKELEAAYADGLVGWQEYEMELREKSARLAAINLASHYVKMGEDLY